MATTRLGDGFGAFWDLLRHLRASPPVLFMQSSGLSNLFVLPLAWLLKIRIVYYFHEPLPFNQKIKNDGFFKGLVMYCLQRNDTFWASHVLVSGVHAEEKARDAFSVKSEKIRMAPLLLSPPDNAAQRNHQSSRRITYLGRIDQRRYLKEFIALADHLQKEGFVPTILTGQPKALRRMVPLMPDSIEVFAIERFSEERKAQILDETAILWNPKSVPIAQSGVTAEAVKFGCSIVLTPFDPQYSVLRDKGLVIDIDDVEKKSGLKRRDEEVKAAASELFDEMHGAGAFASCYQPVLITADDV